tara:strand:+ start:131 stop:373 length:243 start_codon:yes stop_codon:yes gene_type:complete
MTTKKQTAQNVYTQHRKDITILMLWLELELNKHQANASKHSKDWGFVGDLGHVREKLIEMMTFLSHSQQHEIEALLSESR